jgi:hypothetical protein
MLGVLGLAVVIVIGLIVRDMWRQNQNGSFWD